MSGRSVFACVLAVGVFGVTAAAYGQEVQQAVTRADGTAEVAELVELTVTVEKIDLATREATVKHADGRVETIKVGEEVQRLDEVKPGDDVTIQVYQSLALSLDQTSGGAPGMAEASSEVRTEPGELPGGIKTRRVTLVARVTGVDPATKSVTLTGPRGRSAVLEVDDEALAKVKVGDLVEAVYTEALAVSVSRVKVE